MNNLQELKPVGKLSPFAHFCCTIGNLPTSYMISLTYEEQLLWLCQYLEKTVIPAVNTNAEAVAELQNLYVQLKNYVDNYFTNLDVQKEINNKLDEMAQDGTLARIINQEIFTELNNQVQENTQNIQVLQAHDMYVDVVAKGIANDGTDVTANLQNLINEYPNGATFYFKNGTYLFKNIELFSNTKILGDTNTKFIINDDQINKQFIIRNKTNIEFESCYFKNGTTHEQDLIGSTANETNLKCCIDLNNSSHILITNCHFDTISGACFIWALNVNDFTLTNSLLENTAYDMVALLSNCKNFFIQNNHFKNAHTGSTGNSYFISTGVLNYETDTGYADNIHILDNTFENQDTWEAVDSHGCKNFYVENNKFIDCYIPIVIADDKRVVNRVYDMENIFVNNNIIEVSGTIDNFKDYAIIVRGNDKTFKQCKHGSIIGNKIISKNYNGIAGITCRYAEGFEISNNYIYGVHSYAFNLIQVLNTTLINNTMKNCVSDSSTNQRTTDISITNCYLLTLKNNNSQSFDLPYYPVNISAKSYIHFDNTNILFGNTSSTNGEIYHGLGFNSIFKLGDLDYDPATNYPYRRATNLLPQSNAVSNVCTFKTTTNSDIVETSVNALTVIGLTENVEIEGAGVNGDNIQAQIIEFIDGSHVRLSKQMYKTLNATPVNTLAKTFTSL